MHRPISTPAEAWLFASIGRVPPAPITPSGRRAPRRRLRRPSPQHRFPMTRSN